MYFVGFSDIPKARSAFLEEVILFRMQQMIPPSAFRSFILSFPALCRHSQSFFGALKHQDIFMVLSEPKE